MNATCGTRHYYHSTDTYAYKVIAISPTGHQVERRQGAEDNTPVWVITLTGDPTNGVTQVYMTRREALDALARYAR